MVKKICENCGTKNFENAKNCRSCLQILGIKDVTQKSNESIFLQTDFGKIPEPTGYDKPEDYENTTSYWQRIRLVIWDRDIHTIKELSSRSDLQSEATYSLFIVISLISIFTIIDWSITQDLAISTALLTTGVFLLIFSQTYVSIFVFIYLGRVISVTTFTIDRDYVYRPIAYTYPIRALEFFVLLIFRLTDNSFVGLFWILIVVYEFILAISIFSKIFDSKIYLGIITLFISSLIATFVSQFLLRVYFALVVNLF